jgi:hypothetical protein
MPGRNEFDPLAPQKEAAMFYGLFLRGHPEESLRRDIDVPKPLVTKWMRSRAYGCGFRKSAERVYRYRKQVLAIFEELVSSSRIRLRVQ